MSGNKNSGSGGGRSSKSPRYSDRYGPGHVNPYMGGQPKHEILLKEIEMRQNEARREAEEKAARMAAEAAQAEENARAVESPVQESAVQQERASAEPAGDTARGMARRRNREYTHQPRAMRDPAVRERLRQIQRQAIIEVRGENGEPVELVDFDDEPLASDVKFRLSEDNRPLIALEMRMRDGSTSVRWVPVVLSEKEMEELFPAVEPAHAINKEIELTQDKKDPAAEEEPIAAIPEDEAEAPETVTPAAADTAGETDAGEDAESQKESHAEAEIESKIDVDGGLPEAEESELEAAADSENTESTAADHPEAEPELQPAADDESADSSAQADASDQTETVPEGETDIAAAGDENLPEDGEEPSDDAGAAAGEDDHTTAEKVEIPTITYYEEDDDPQYDDSADETQEESDEPQPEDADAAAVEDQPDGTDGEDDSTGEEEPDSADEPDDSDDEDEPDGTDEPEDAQEPEERYDPDESREPQEYGSDPDDEGESEQPEDEPNDENEDEDEDTLDVDEDIRIAEPKKTEERQRRSAVAVRPAYDEFNVGTRYTDSRYLEESTDQDDSLFLRKERPGSTALFVMPEGVKLPRYIDDDDFVERWLGEKEDEEMASDSKRRRRRISTIVGALTMVLAMVGLIAIARWGIGMLGGIGNVDSQKSEYAEFISPVVMSEVPAFETWDAMPQDKLLQSAVFSVLLDMDVAYERDDTGKFIVPSTDIVNAVKKLYGAYSTGSGEDGEVDIDTQIRNALYLSAGEDTTNTDVYYVDMEDSFHVADGLSGPSPQVVDIARRDNTVTLTVEYLEDLEIGSGGILYSRQLILILDGDGYYIQAVREIED